MRLPTFWLSPRSIGRIMKMHRRLSTGHQYEGTGIGLSRTGTIVDRPGTAFSVDATRTLPP